jgi:hypothetical protein
MGKQFLTFPENVISPADMVFLGCLTLKIKALHFFEMSGTCSTILHHIP